MGRRGPSKSQPRDPGFTIRLDPPIWELVDAIVEQSDGLLDRTKAIRWAVKLAAKTMARRLEAMNAIAPDLDGDKTPSRDDLEAARDAERRTR